MSTYELVTILKSSLSDEDISKFQETLRTLVESNGGKILKTENMGKRKLAYEVKGEKKGIYTLQHFEGSGTAVAEAERVCRLDETIIKFMTVKLTRPRPIKSKPSRSDGRDESGGATGDELQ